ncbi:HAD family hydrolase [Arthrobacter sp. MSA 4-2]|uniref:HAD family hydrolase n=1 Tax=Arthrobacter sp. MSA 4-2 TaxID=2794349 RepID=UPI0018E84F46|nr:HAD family hydrolase [Arthrobacter sp. MSA 4-2]MBJ2122508.1 HAD family hydrolase [Arthrobacter sp. MSA 4-2]
MSAVPGEGAPVIEGVLFDIDDTLVDLETAMGRTLHHIAGDAFGHLSDDDWAEYKRLFTTDPQGHYEAFLAGQVTFAEQRLRRARHAQASFIADPLEGEAAHRWSSAYEATLPLHFRPYDDVMPLLDELEARGVPYGAVSNNVHDYQRAKLDRSGLSRIRVLVGIDAVGVAKPDPPIFHEGARRLGTDPARTLYVGDHPAIDARAADAAGLVGVWLDRRGAGSHSPSRPSGASEGGAEEAGTAGEGLRRITSLDAVLQFLPSFR